MSPQTINILLVITGVLTMATQAVAQFAPQYASIALAGVGVLGAVNTALASNAHGQASGSAGATASLPSAAEQTADAAARLNAPLAPAPAPAVKP